MSFRPSIPQGLSPRRPLHWFSTGFGAGFFPWAPGTAGSLMGWGTFAALSALLPRWSWWVLVPAALWAGAWACDKVSREIGQADPPQLAIDEVVAVWLVLAAAPVWHPSWRVQALGFALFRLFDIVKRGPVGWVDRNLHGGWGIMLDDVVAALLTLFVLWGANALLA